MLAGKVAVVAGYGDVGKGVGCFLNMPEQPLISQFAVRGVSALLWFSCNCD